MTDENLVIVCLISLGELVPLCVLTNLLRPTASRVDLGPVGVEIAAQIPLLKLLHP